MTSIYWLIAFVILVGIEAATMALTTIWFAGGALAAFLVSLAGAATEVQLVVFVIVSFVLLFLTRPVISRYLHVPDAKTNAEGLIGRQARVTEEIDNSLGTGTAIVGGQEWTARALYDGDIYPADTMVTIKKIQGVKLIVTTSQEDM